MTWPTQGTLTLSPTIALLSSCPPTCPASSHLRAFALAIPPAWNALPLDLLPFFLSQPKGHLLKGHLLS